jgi:hypothetical protein
LAAPKASQRIIAAIKEEGTKTKNMQLDSFGRLTYFSLLCCFFVSIIFGK